MFTPSIPVSVCHFFFAHAALHLALLLSSLCSYATGEQEGRRTKNLPNFIVILADDLAWDDIGAFGNTKVHTPHHYHSLSPIPRLGQHPTVHITAARREKAQ